MCDSTKKISDDSTKLIDHAFSYTRGGCPLQAAHIIGDLIRRIQELEGSQQLVKGE